MKSNTIIFILQMICIASSITCPSWPNTPTSIRVSYNVLQGEIYVEHLSISATVFYLYENVDFTINLFIGIHFKNCQDCSLETFPPPSIIGYQSSSDILVNDDDVSYIGIPPADYIAFGSSIDNTNILSFNFTGISGNPCSGLYQFTENNNIWYDACSNTGSVTNGQPISYTCQAYQPDYPCDSSCSNRSCYGPGLNMCCDEACLSCFGNSSSTCSTCRTGYYMQPSNTTCLTTCPPGYYPNSITLTCEKCESHTCATCLSPPDSGCISCLEGYYLQPLSTTCLAACPVGYYQDFFNSVCETCNPSCAACYGPSSSNCTTCIRGLVLFPSNSSCLMSCPQSFYYKNSTSACESCDSSCAKCFGPTNLACASCKSGYYLQPASTTCLNSCPDGFFNNILTRICVSCSYSCATCTGPAGNSCTTCHSNTYLQPLEALCLEDCPEDYFPENSTQICRPCSLLNCSECENNINTTDNTNSTCVQCSSSCNTPKSAQNPSHSANTLAIVLPIAIASCLLLVTLVILYLRRKRKSLLSHQQDVRSETQLTSSPRDLIRV